MPRLRNPADKARNLIGDDWKAGGMDKLVTEGREKNGPAIGEAMGEIPTGKGWIRSF